MKLEADKIQVTVSRWLMTQGLMLSQQKCLHDGVNDKVRQSFMSVSPNTTR